MEILFIVFGYLLCFVYSGGQTLRFSELIQKLTQPDFRTTTTMSPSRKRMQRPLFFCIWHLVKGLIWKQLLAEHVFIQFYSLFYELILKSSFCWDRIFWYPKIYTMQCTWPVIVTVDGDKNGINYNSVLSQKHVIFSFGVFFVLIVFFYK